MASAYLAAITTVPHPVPDFALQATAVYRLEIGGACFTVLYFAVMALVLALEGRGFAEFGAKGLRAVEVTRTANKQHASLSEQIKLTRSIENRLKEIESAMQSANKTLNEQEERLDRLERE